MTEEQYLTKETAAEIILANPYAFLTGPAGAGKSYQISWMTSQGVWNPCIASTTGISAVNLGTQTINSWLKYFDTFSLRQNRLDGKLKRTLHRIALTFDSLVIDEVSMMDKAQLQIIYDEVAEFNFERSHENKPEFRLMITGDALQLPPIPEKKGQPTPWFFLANCYAEFEKGMVRLNKIHRQSNPIMLDALNAIRVGNGQIAADLLISSRLCEFAGGIDPDFDGTTLVSKNDKVNRLNYDALMKLSGDILTATSRYWWKEPNRKTPSEWKNIPGAHTEEYSMQDLKLKLGAYVMILANDTSEYKSYVNGDCGHIKDVVMREDNTIERVTITLVRNGEEVEISKIVRDALTPDAPYGMNEKDIPTMNDEKGHVGYLDGQVVKSKKNNRYIVGQIEYLPVRLGYASTVHKCLSENMIVSTTRGLIPIKDVQAGDFVVTHDGDPYEVLAKAHSGKKECLYIRTSGGRYLVCSPEHKIRVSTANGHVWKEAQHLQTGDMLTTQQWISGGELETPLPDISQFYGPRSKQLSVPKYLTEDLAWWLGVLIGDGSYTDREEGDFWFTTSSPEVADRFTKILNSMGIFVGSRDKYDNKKCIDLWFNSLPLRQWLAEIGLDYTKAANKTVPKIILSANSGIRAAFLQGLFDSDGSVNSKGYIIFTTISLDLVRTVQLLLDSLGIESRRGTPQESWYTKDGEKVYTGSKNYQLRIMSHCCPRFMELVGFSRQDRISRWQEAPVNKPSQSMLVPYTDKIVEIVDYACTVDTYDIEVETNHNFYANGLLVSNSQGLSLDRVQVDMTDGFFGHPAMAYVAFSRAKTLEGLRIVGNGKLLAQRVKVDEMVRRFL